VTPLLGFQNKNHKESILKVPFKVLNLF